MKLVKTWQNDSKLKIPVLFAHGKVLNKVL